MFNVNAYTCAIFLKSMKHILISAVLSTILLLPSTAQTEGDNGTVSGKIYSHFNLSLGEQPTPAFEVRRAYFGYKRNLDDHFFAEVKLDIGSINDVSEFALIRRYTYFKNAYMGYRKGDIRAWFGLFDMLQFKVQEKFWDHRYLYKSFMDEYRFGSSADIGTGIQWSPSEKFSGDLILSNGEGYKNMQFDRSFRLGAGLTMVPVENLTLRAYYTILTHESMEMIFSGFAGYRLGNLKIAAEYNHQKNFRTIVGHDRFGYSVYSMYQIHEKWELFARYDQLYSNILDGEEVPWNLANDGSAIIAGIQFSPTRFTNFALNYQDWVEYAANGGNEPFLYLNIEIVF